MYWKRHTDGGGGWMDGWMIERRNNDLFIFGSVDITFRVIPSCGIQRSTFQPVEPVCNNDYRSITGQASVKVVVEIIRIILRVAVNLL